MIEAERITKIMSGSGHCSRREAERLIADGRISVNGKTVREQGTRIVPGKDKLFLDGKELEITYESRIFKYFLLNKPAGYLTTCKDPFKRRTIFDIIKVEGHFFPVGRLDLNSRGLLLITNDGAMCDLIIHPSNEVKKTYRVLASKLISDSRMLMLKSGIEYEGEIYRAENIEIIGENRFHAGERGVLYQIELIEGKKREIRQMFKALGVRVIDLERISVGPLTIEGISEGEFRELSPAELKELKKYVGYDEAIKK
ncbi:MAG TPA: pseudouridine synthase [Candidatus Wallbacteria bacterium]|nr:pseudouridine synthase [Candidatus Wallbacteria bacterium]